LLLTDIQRKAGQQGAMMMAGGGGMGVMGNPEDDKIAGLMENGHGEIPFTVGLGLGINSNSDNQLLAWEFIKFLSNEGVTESMRMRGLPTHIGAFEERAALSITGQLFASAMREGMGEIPAADLPSAADLPPEGMIRDELNAVDLEVLAEYIAMVEYFTNQLNTFFTTDSIIEEIVLTEAEEFFNGSRTAEDVAETLQSRISLVLNE
jgi:ABC-type glycerol-3-phosphate transport system substrate-binding protein